MLDMARKCTGHVFVYFPDDDSIAGVDCQQLDDKLGFTDNPPEIANVGRIDYGKAGTFQAIVVDVFSGLCGSKCLSGFKRVYPSVRVHKSKLIIYVLLIICCTRQEWKSQS